MSNPASLFPETIVPAPLGWTCVTLSWIAAPSGDVTAGEVEVQQWPVVAWRLTHQGAMPIPAGPCFPGMKCLLALPDGRYCEASRFAPWHHLGEAIEEYRQTVTAQLAIGRALERSFVVPAPRPPPRANGNGPAQGDPPAGPDWPSDGPRDI